VTFLDDDRPPMAPDPTPKKGRKKPPSTGADNWRAAADSFVFGRWIALLSKCELGVLLWVMQASKGRNRGHATGSYRRIAGATGLDVRTVRRGIAGLIQRGLIRHAHKGTSKRDPTVWQLLRVPPIEVAQQGALVPTVQPVPGDTNRGQGWPETGGAGAHTDPEGPCRQDDPTPTADAAASVAGNNGIPLRTMRDVPPPAGASAAVAGSAQGSDRGIN